MAASVFWFVPQTYIVLDSSWSVLMIILAGISLSASHSLGGSIQSSKYLLASGKFLFESRSNRPYDFSIQFMKLTGSQWKNVPSWLRLMNFYRHFGGYTEFDLLYGYTRQSMARDRIVFLLDGVNRPIIRSCRYNANAHHMHQIRRIELAHGLRFSAEVRSYGP